jgi:hypothetical protein
MAGVSLRCTTSNADNSYVVSIRNAILFGSFDLLSFIDLLSSRTTIQPSKISSSLFAVFKRRLAFWLLEYPLQSRSQKDLLE